MRISRGLLAESVLSVNAPDVVEIACLPSSLPIIMEGDKKIITEAVARAVGEPVKIEFVVLDTVPEPANLRTRPKRQIRKPHLCGGLKLKTIHNSKQHLLSLRLRFWKPNNHVFSNGKDVFL